MILGVALGAATLGLRNAGVQDPAAGLVVKVKCATSEWSPYSDQQPHSMEADTLLPFKDFIVCLITNACLFVGIYMFVQVLQRPEENIRSPGA